MKIESQVRIEAPPRLVFEFFAWLDHLRLVSPSRRREWCPVPGQRVAEGTRQEVCLEQGRHRVRLSFVTEILRPAETIVDVFSSWPLHGARRILRLQAETPEHPAPPVTWVIEETEWSPPFLVRRLVDKRLEQQRLQFQEKLDNARLIIEKVYAELGSEAFERGVLEPARQVGFSPIDERLNLPPVKGG